MSKQSTKSASRPTPSGPGGNGGATSGSPPSETQEEGRTGMIAGASHLAHEAADTVMHAASTGASSVKRQVAQALDRQVASGADVINQVARTTRRAADDLEREAPQLASVIRTVADKVDTYADDLKTKSIDDLVRSAADFTRRQPVAVFGFAAIAGFLAFRMLTTASSPPMPEPGGPSHGGRRPSADESHRRPAGSKGESGDHVS